MFGKRPYQYVEEILRLRTATERRKALRKITDDRMRANVRFHIEDYFARVFKKELPDYKRIVDEETASGDSGGPSIGSKHDRNKSP